MALVQVVRLDGKVGPGQSSDRSLRLIFDSALAKGGRTVATEVFTKWVWAGEHSPLLQDANDRRAAANRGPQPPLQLDTAKVRHVRQLLQAASYVVGGLDFQQIFNQVAMWRL